ncbi:MAG: putative lipoprotein [Fibrobacteria bacterium]|jgi:TolA-binding protein/parvulin-like peptidyl-prolyl isomerase|nr:putative lipoprotein [Fibrobacteria bacterium]
MRKSLIMIPVLAAIAACGSSGEKGHTLARIDGDKFTEGDLDLRLSTLDEARREEVLRDPELRRREFENILRNRLYALAGQTSAHGKSKPLQRRLALIDQRVITQYYFETFLNGNAGLTLAQIEAYYEANPSQFKGDSGKTLPLTLARARIIDTLILKSANFDSIYRANNRNFVRRANVDVGLIQVSSRKEADAALKALKKGMSFGAAAAKYSQHASKSNQGNAGSLTVSGLQYDIGSQVVSDSLFFGPNRLKPGQYSAPIAKDGKFLIVTPLRYEAEYTPPLSEVRSQIAADYLRDYRGRLGQEAVASLKAKHKARLVSLDKGFTEKDLRAYYEQHKDAYESPETFELYHIEASGEARLKAEFGKVRDLEQFKALASKISENKLTKPQQGYLGDVKRDFSLPYGIGTMPALFATLDESQPGKVETLVQNPSNQTWHAFWLVKKGERRLKPFDRVRALVQEDLKANRIESVNARDSLAVIGASGLVIREEDVLFLREEIPPQMQERYSREQLVDYLLIWRIVADEALSLGLDKERKLRALRLQNEDSYWGKVYQDSILSKTWEEDPALLAKTFKAQRPLFTQDEKADWKPHARNIAAYLQLTPQDFNLEYHTNPDRYMRDTVRLSLAEARNSVFQGLLPTAYARLDERVLAKLKARFKVKIEDPTLNEPPLEPAAAYKKAQDLHYDRKLDQALALYEKLRVKFPANAGLQDSVSFGIAQIYIEQERYPQAMSEYRRVSYLYPKSPNDYKAMFMVGFIYSEHLKNDSAAVRAFEAMIAKYPKSDLTDDADWMVRNIRSGGKLMPVLEDEPAEPEQTQSKETR